jgi:hypothetical protein
MNHHEQRDDSALTRELRESLTGIAAPQRPPLETITARGRAHRRRRRTARAALPAVGLAAATALALGLAGAFGAAPSRGTGTIRTAAFTLVEHANGTATVTINMNLLQDPGALQRALRQDGILAIVRAGSFCSSDPIPAGFAQVVTGVTLPYSTGPAPSPSFTINPAAMPAGTELSFAFWLPWNSRIKTAIELIDTNSYTCSRTAPPAPPPGEGVIVEYAGSQRVSP